MRPSSRLGEQGTGTAAAAASAASTTTTTANAASNSATATAAPKTSTTNRPLSRSAAAPSPALRPPKRSGSSTSLGAASTKTEDDDEDDEEEDDEGTANTHDDDDDPTWSADDSALLKKLVEQYRDTAPRWTEIASNFDQHSAIECLSHWQSLTNPPCIKGKGSWTAEEDQILREKRAIYGRKWAKIAAHLPGRQGKQCRERFVNHLDPELKKGDWTGTLEPDASIHQCIHQPSPLVSAPKNAFSRSIILLTKQTTRKRY